MKTTYTKMDDAGKFIYFPGVTVVSSVLTSDFEWWEGVFNRLEQSDLIKQYYSILPFESYHMTTFNMYTTRNYVGDDWNKFINQKLGICQKIHQNLSKYSEQPECSVVSINCSEVIQLTLKISETQERLLRSSMDAFSQEGRCPEVFHITLAYENKTIPFRKSLQLLHHINSLLLPLFAGKSFKLNPPGLCYFKDMTAFLPWNGDCNPFEKECDFNGSKNPGFFPNETKKKIEDVAHNDCLII